MSTTKLFSFALIILCYLERRLRGLLTDHSNAGSASMYHNLLRSTFNPLSPHDAVKHHFTSLKTDLIFLQQRVLV